MQLESRFDLVGEGDVYHGVMAWFPDAVAVDEVPAIEHFLGDSVCTVSFKLLER